MAPECLAFFFSQPRARGGPPSDRIVWKRMEKIPLKLVMTKRAASGRRILSKRSMPTPRRLARQRFIRICTCPAEQKSRLNKKVCSLPTAAHFHSDKIPNIRTSPLSLFVSSSEEKTTRDSPEFEASVSTSRHGDISRHKTEDAEGLQTPHKRYLERREMMFTWVAKRNTF